MARASRAEAAQHREDVVEATSRLVRERGTAGASVQEIMSAVGLTHGGFYKHFGSKDELMGIAAANAFGEILALLARLQEEFPDRSQAWSELLRDYLSPAHRDAPGTGCANTALAADSARAAETSALRESYSAGVRDTLDALAAYEEAPGLAGEEVRRRAVADFAAMVGALTLSRATAGTPLSEEILRTVQEDLEERR